MPTSYRILTARSISSAVKNAIQVMDDWADEPYCWFRGVNSNRHSLIPGAHRRDDFNECEVLTEFVQRGVAFGKVTAVDDWDTYYLAQHHGIPTRLLDWTESFMASLFFAFDGWDGSNTPAVWILRPYLLNKAFLGWPGILGPERTPETQIWLPRSVAEENPSVRQDSKGYVYDNEWPLALFPRWSNQRITTQQGMFTVHGRAGTSLDKLIEMRGANPRECIARIDLKGFERERVYDQLAMLGVRRSAIYPDLDGFVRELRERLHW